MKDQLLAKKYSETINKYISKGYATNIKAPEAHNNIIILLSITNLKTESLTNLNQINEELFLMAVLKVKVTVLMTTCW